jgi:glycosyltransferase involved in cell wall biosynthesis
MPRQPSVLLVLPQLPQDPASGAARSLNTICHMLAEAGFAVRALATTASELETKQKAEEYLHSLGLTVSTSRASGARPELVFVERGVSYRLLDTGHQAYLAWPKLYNRQFDGMFDQELRQFQPDILFTFGGSPGDEARRRKARRQGVKVVFGLRNEGYLMPGGIEETDAILSASHYLSERYRQVAGIESTPLPLPIDREEVVAEEHQPIFVTMINPSPAKGLMLFARIAEQLIRRSPDIALLVIESRGSGGMLAGAALAGGFDLRQYENVMVSTAVPQPKDIYAGTRVLVAPSVAAESAGRVAAEALMNGIPPIVSDRGGLAEVANGGGFVLPIPAEITPQRLEPVSAESVEAWVELILRLEDDAFYAEASQRAREAGKIYHRENLLPRYKEFFERVLMG